MPKFQIAVNELSHDITKAFALSCDEESVTTLHVDSNYDVDWTKDIE